MTLTLDAIRGLTTYSLTDRAPFILLKEDGLGLAPLHRLTERGPQQHGETDLGYYLDPRIMKYVFGFEGDDEADYYDQRAALLAIFAPSADPILLRYTLPNGEVRQIDAHYLSDLTLSSEGRYGAKIQKVGVILKAADPLFYDPTQQALTYSLGGGSGGFTVPVVIPMAVGASDIDQARVITYEGSFEEYPVITITGPIEDPLIENETTGDTLSFAGVTIAGGDSYIIDTRYGYKTVTNLAGTDKSAELTEDSDLATFRLAANPEAPGGLNSIRVSGLNVTTATEVYFRYYHRYNGF